eukprot:1195722-Prorocentrum_minimum.AAC.3
MVAPEPQTEAGERRPDRASAMPSACFCFSFNFVTADPSTKYKHTCGHNITSPFYAGEFTCPPVFVSTAHARHSYVNGPIRRTIGTRVAKRARAQASDAFAPIGRRVLHPLRLVHAGAPANSLQARKRNTPPAGTQAPRTPHTPSDVRT